jgi:hypothetical protein
MTPAGTCPEARRTSNRRKALKRTWSGKEWREARAAFLKEHPFCQFHEDLDPDLEVPATHPHHPYMESTKGGYLDLSRCIPLCAACHTALHHGLNLCPKCRIHYKRWDQPECRRCWDAAHPEIVQARAEAKQRMKERRRELDRKVWVRAKARYRQGF